MKLIRHGEPGRERAGAIDHLGQSRDISLLVPDLTPDWLAPAKLRALAAIDLNKMPVVPAGTRLGVPVSGIRQFIAVGLNYRRHAAETGLAIPVEPVVFNKALTSLSGPDDDVVLPAGSEKCDWEIELAIVMGTTARNVTADDALSYVAGYSLANDVSERNWQMERGGQWMKGKSFDTFGPVGPWLVTTDELSDPQNIPLELSVNGEMRQCSNTSDMIFPVHQIVSYLSKFMTLLPGDIILTGTPEGVGLGMKPAPIFLRPGDTMTLDGGSLGVQRQKVLQGG
ncbi:MAG: fumarylacetoacetate hydrolase family protein [Pigmentiphaga sp.]